MRVLGELMPLQYGVQFSIVARMKRDNRSSSQYGLALIQLLDIWMSYWQTPEESRQSLDIAAFLEGLADGGNLADGK